MVDQRRVYLDAHNVLCEFLCGGVPYGNELTD